MYDSNGVAYRVDDYSDLSEFLFSNNAMCFAENLSADSSFSFLDAAVRYSKVLCDKKGRPTSVRLTGKGSRWIVGIDRWGNDNFDTDFLINMQELFDWFGVGAAPTPSSLGVRLMRQMHYDNKLRKHTALSLACEDYLHKFGFGGIVQTPGLGNNYEELIQLDAGSHYLKHYTVHVDGAGVWFINGNCDKFVSYFAECEVEVNEDLPLGPFPIREKKRGRVVYPTTTGKFRTHLWKEQVDCCIQAGCKVRILSGYGWRSFTEDNLFWARHAYWLRKAAPTSFIEEKSKSIAVSAIGHHGMGRKQQYLVSEEDATALDLPIINEYGEPINFFVHEERDNTSALMVHWNLYTVLMANVEAYLFALPFAKQGRLVSLDYDAVLALEHDERNIYIEKKTMASSDVPPGTWLWTLLHNVSILAPRSYISDELTRRPGVPKSSRSR